MAKVEQEIIINPTLFATEKPINPRLRRVVALGGIVLSITGFTIMGQQGLEIGSGLINGLIQGHYDSDNIAPTFKALGGALIVSFGNGMIELANGSGNSKFSKPNKLSGEAPMNILSQQRKPNTINLSE